MLNDLFQDRDDVVMEQVAKVKLPSVVSARVDEMDRDDTVMNVAKVKLLVCLQR